MEEDVYDDPLEEIEALGGDPFFLQDTDEESNDENDSGNFIWDGEVDENAHLDIELDG